MAQVESNTGGDMRQHQDMMRRIEGEFDEEDAFNHFMTWTRFERSAAQNDIRKAFLGVEEEYKDLKLPDVIPGFMRDFLSKETPVESAIFYTAFVTFFDTGRDMGYHAEYLGFMEFVRAIKVHVARHIARERGMLVETVQDELDAEIDRDPAAFRDVKPKQHYSLAKRYCLELYFMYTVFYYMGPMKGIPSSNVPSAEVDLLKTYLTVAADDIYGSQTALLTDNDISNRSRSLWDFSDASDVLNLYRFAFIYTVFYVPHRPLPDKDILAFYNVLCAKLREDLHEKSLPIESQPGFRTPVLKLKFIAEAFYGTGDLQATLNALPGPCRITFITEFMHLISKAVAFNIQLSLLFHLSEPLGKSIKSLIELSKMAGTDNPRIPWADQMDEHERMLEFRLLIKALGADELYVFPQTLSLQTRELLVIAIAMQASAPTFKRVKDTLSSKDMMAILFFAARFRNYKLLQVAFEKNSLSFYKISGIGKYASPQLSQFVTSLAEIPDEFYVDMLQGMETCLDDNLPKLLVHASPMELFVDENMHSNPVSWPHVRRRCKSVDKNLPEDLSNLYTVIQGCESIYPKAAEKMLQLLSYKPQRQKAASYPLD